MKKMKTYILGMVLAFAMILLPQNVSAATQIPVTAVEDITAVMAVGSTNIKVPTGEYSNVVQFSLNKPSYVYVSAYSTVMHEDYDSLGAIEEFAVYSDANCSNLVTGDEVSQNICASMLEITGFALLKLKTVVTMMTVMASSAFQLQPSI